MTKKGKKGGSTKKPTLTKAQKLLKGRNFAKEGLQWRKERPSQLIKEIKDLGYLKNEPKQEVRKGEPIERNRGVSKDKDSNS